MGDSRRLFEHRRVRFADRAATSNDFSQRTLGRGWKFLQRQTYTLFVLTWLHTAGFLLVTETGRFEPVLRFLTSTVLAVVAQFSGFVHTVRFTKGPTPRRAPARSRHAGSKAVPVEAARWVAVVALWSLSIFGVYPSGPWRRRAVQQA